MFNTDKCVVTHMGCNKTNFQYMMGTQKLKDIQVERDLGVLVDNKLNFNEQCSKAVKEANSALGMIRRNIKTKSKEIVIPLYKALVRPKLEYCVQLWNPFLKFNIDKMEKVQRRATKLINEFKKLPYEMRLYSAGLTSLKERRDRGDLIQVYKIMKGFDKVDYRNWFTLSETTQTRVHRYKIEKSRTRLNTRKFFFSNRVVDSWNNLPARVVDIDSVNCFKDRMDNFFATMKRN